MTEQPELDGITITLWVKYGSPGTMDEFVLEANKSLLDWHNKQIEEAMAKFHLKKGVKYDVKASDSVIVITRTNKLKGQTNDQL